MKDGVLGFIDTPAQGNGKFLSSEMLWSADNGCFGKNYKGDEAWFKWLSEHTANRSNCLFATAPDVVGDAGATLERSVPWLAKIRELGYPAALVAQDGLENLVIPWDEFDCLFIGGTTEWKLGPEARELIREAKRRGKWVHMGRVNSGKRYAYAEAIGCDSVDGTFLVFGPDKNLPRLLAWISQPGLGFDV